MPRPRKRLPTNVYSHLGPVPVVRQDDKLKGLSAMGLWEPDNRTISVLTGLSIEAELQTLCHEITHVALGDAGVQVALSHDQCEAVADAVGTYLAAAVAAGFISLKGLR